MTLQRLNPTSPESAEAMGFMAPYVRIATHVGFAIAWVALTTDEEWASGEDRMSATQQRVQEDMREAMRHLTADNFAWSPFIGTDQIDLMSSLKAQVLQLSEEVPGNRQETLQALQTLSDNLAYAAARFEYHTAGNERATEGRNP